MINRLCAVLERLPWLRNRYYQMKRRMFLYYPREEETVRRKACYLCLKVWSVFLCGSVYFAVTLQGGYEKVCLAICIFYMAYRLILSKAMEKEQRNLLKELEVFLGELRFQYSYCRRIEDALEETIDRSQRMMQIHGRMIADSLDDEELEEGYIPKAPVRFLTQLLILCKSNFIYGDCEPDKKSVFLSNVGLIKENVEAELLKRKKTEYLFSGLLITCMLPIGAIPVIEMWAVSNMKELKVYYYGTYGMVTTIVLCLMTLLFYEVIRHMQYEEPAVSTERRWLQRLMKIRWIDRWLSWQLNLNYKKTLAKHQMLKRCGVKENVKQFLLLQYLTALAAVLVLTAGVLQYRNISRNQILIQAEKRIDQIYEAEDEEKEKLHRLTEKMVKGEIPAEVERLQLTACPKELKNTIIHELDKEKENWKNWREPWFLWLIPITGAMAAYHLRYGMLTVKQRYTGLKREEEILTMQTVILSLMHADRMTGEEIACWLEKVAIYFRECIEKVYYRLIYQNYEEMQSVKKEETYVPIALILEGIMACDRLTVSEAFLQMESNYRYTAEKYKSESNNYIRDRSAVCKVLAFAPLYMTVTCKLIVPFVLEGLSQLASYSESMQQLM